MQCFKYILKPIFHNITVVRSGINTAPLKMSKSIPDRWIPYKAYGKVIEGTRIVCFKVPLRKGVQEHNEAIKEIWDIKTLLDKLPKLGAVVDLTNTARYYNPGELRDAGVLHKKILMPGRVIPPEKKVTEFMDTIDEFLGKDCDIIIGVHCTHGLNRTGYMVCRYMRDRLGIQAADAITRFEEARGYKIERENYIADLLGKKVPPPDVGKRETMIKPLHDQIEESGHITEARHKNRWRNNKRSQYSNQSGCDNGSGYDKRPRYNNRPGNDKRSKYDNRPGHNYRSGYDNQSEFHSRPGSDNNRPESDNRPGSDNRSGPDHQPGPDNRYSNRSMQYISPLGQHDDTERQHTERQSNGFSTRFNYNPYSRNRNDDEQKKSASNASGKSSSRWDMSGMSHGPRKTQK